MHDSLVLPGACYPTYYAGMSDQVLPPAERPIEKIQLPHYRSVPTRPGMRHRDIVGAELGVTSFFVGDTLLAPGGSVPLHTHPVEEVLIALDGTLTVTARDQTIELDSEEGVVVPPGTPHKFENRTGGQVHLLSAGPWDRATFFTSATTYLEGQPRESSE